MQVPNLLLYLAFKDLLKVHAAPRITRSHDIEYPLTPVGSIPILHRRTSCLQHGLQRPLLVIPRYCPVLPGVCLILPSPEPDNLDIHKAYKWKPVSRCLDMLKIPMITLYPYGCALESATFQTHLHRHPYNPS